MLNPEYHVVEREQNSYVYFPRKKVFCEVSKLIGKTLIEYQSNHREKIGNKEKEIVEEFISLVDNYPEAKNVLLNTIEGITMILATDCNLRCSYCYAEDGTYHRKKKLMSVETAIQSVKTLFSLFPAIRNIRFFGGEPLLNVKVISEVCRYIDEKLGKNDIYYTLETNGTILSDEILKLAKKYNFNISVSCDGPENYHDLHRKCHNGNGTYQKVMNNVEKLKEEGIKFGFQCTYTEVHKDLSREELTKHLTKDTPFYKISPMITDDTAINMDHEFMFAPIEYLLSKQPLFHSPTIQMISGILSSINSSEFCEAQSRVTIFPDGDVYPCELLDQDKFYMGNVNDLSFPGNEYKAVRESLNKFNRDHLLQDYWFRYLLNPVCIADVLYPDFNLEKPIELSAELATYYEKLIIELIKIKDSDQWDVFKSNIDKYLQGSRVRYGDNQ